MKINIFPKICFLIISLVLSSCAYSNINPTDANIRNKIIPGRTVLITTKNKKKYEFVVIKTTNHLIIGVENEIPIKNIKKLELKNVKERKKRKMGKKEIALITFLKIGLIVFEVLLTPPCI